MLNPNLAESDQASIAQKAKQARAGAQAPPAPAARQALLQQAAELLSREDAVLVAHYYVDSDLQELWLDLWEKGHSLSLLRIEADAAEEHG